MKAIILKQNGGPENLVVSEIPQPQIGDNEVLVNVKAISVNPVDTAVRQNRQVMEKIMKTTGNQEYYIPGWDISGTVVKTGKHSASFENREVFGMVNFPGQGRAYAEYVAAPYDQLAFKPAKVSHQEAAASTLAALTAWQALVTYGKIKKGDKVLIHAAAGGVGHFAVQIARNLGAYVIGTASSQNRDFVKSLGASEFIDYQNERFEQKVKDADLVIDSINSKDNLKRSIEACRQGGRIISIKYYFDDDLKEMAVKKQLYTERMLVSSNGSDMKSIALLLEKGFVKPYISAVFPFSSMPEAHKQVETGKTRGKVIVVLENEPAII